MPKKVSFKARRWRYCRQWTRSISDKRFLDGAKRPLEPIDPPAVKEAKPRKPHKDRL